MQQRPRTVLFVLMILVLSVGLSAGRAKAGVISEVDIPITGATFNGLSHDFNITGRPAADVMVFYNDGRQPNPVAQNFAIFSLSTIGLTNQISQNGSTITYSSSNSNIGNISLLDGNNGFSPLLIASLVSLEMHIIRVVPQ